MRALGKIVVLTAVLGATLVLASAPAFALKVYQQSSFGSFGSAGVGSGQFDGPTGVAVSEASGDVYVADSGNNRVEEFNSTGTGVLGEITGSSGPPAALSSPGGLAVDNSGSGSDPSNGDLYVIDGGHDVIDKFSSTGSYEGQLTGTCPSPGTCPVLEVIPFGGLLGVAVDRSGNLWVSDSVNGQAHVDEFSDTGSFIKSYNTLRGSAPGIAVDSDDDVYLVYADSQVSKRNSNGVEGAEEGSLFANALAVDPVTNNLFVDRSQGFGSREPGGEIEEFPPFGEPLSPVAVFATVGLAESFGVAVNGADGTVYATEDGADEVEIFPQVVVPDVTTLPASGVTQTAATLNGTVNPDEIPVSSCEFEYRSETEASYEKTVGCSPAPGSGGSAVAVSAEISVTIGTLYYYRLVASNTNGSNAGKEETFTAAPAVEGVVTGAAEDVTSKSALVTGSLAPDGTEAHYYFQYGTEAPAYGLLSPALPGTDAGTGPQAHAETRISGLQDGTEYHYRLVATNALGTTYGQDRVLKTPPERPDVVSESASRIFPQTALLSAVVNPERFNTTYQFLYGPTASYGSSVPLSEVELGTGSAGLLVFQSIAGLQLGTTYHYAVQASNLAGVTVGPDQTFTTPPAAVPLVTTGTASEVSQNTATISGSVNPQGVPTSYEFDLGTDTTYGSHIFGEVGGGTEPVALSLGLQGLTAGTLYHYRLVATNAYGTVYGADQTFMTPGFPTALIVGPVGAPLVPTPVFTTPSTSGATVEIAPGNTKHKTRKRAKAKKKERGSRPRKASGKKGRGGR